MYTIYFDMDGTIADFYGVENWLDYLLAEKTFPYISAKPLVDNNKLETILLKLQKIGYSIGIISWTSKGGSTSYNSKVRKAKLQWLSEYFPKINFDEIHIVKYGTRKDYVAKNKYGIIFDDDDNVRNNWRGVAVNPMTENIVDFLTQILNASE